LSALLTTATQDFPLNKDMKSKLAGNGCSVETVCKVTRAKDVYVYMYSIRNTGDKPIKTTWFVTNMAMYFGHNFELLVELKPNENAVFTLEHPDPPVPVNGAITLFYLTSKEEIEKMIAQTPDLPKKMKVIVSDGLFHWSTGGSGMGALPKSFVYEKPAPE
ncbi:MAG: hypothetical protein GTO02_22820, partial [Candidatus Dadabacteria bacterium]|nr:hypothetical protein [Candidatus Dadabacteria bacterium]